MKLLTETLRSTNETANQPSIQQQVQTSFTKLQTKF